MPVTDSVENSVPKRVKLVQIALSFTCDADTDAFMFKSKLDAIIADNPAINMTFNITERTMMQRSV